MFKQTFLTNLLPSDDTIYEEPFYQLFSHLLMILHCIYVYL